MINTTPTAKKKVYILLNETDDDRTIGVWSNLKKLCLEMRSQQIFPSYSKLVKMDKSTGVLKFKSKDKVHYQIQIHQVK